MSPDRSAPRRAHLSTLARLVAAGCATAMLPASPARAQDAGAWPQRTVKIVVPYAPGASSDNVARRLALALADRLGQGVVVENRTGAAGTIGTAYVGREKPDGYTLLAHDSGFLLQPHLIRDLPVGPDDLTPIAGFVFAPFGIVVQSSSPHRTLQDLIDAARANPEKVSYGSGGIGTTPHLASEQFARAAGVKLYHVTYKGAADAVVGLLGGQIDMQFVTLTTVLPHLRSGRLRMLAVSADQRLKVVPEVPTFTEAGLRDFRVSSWLALWGPKGLPAPVLERLRREVVASMATPELVAFAEGFGALPRVVVGDELARLIGEESARLKVQAEQLGLERK